jgi:hypothetical protein
MAILGIPMLLSQLSMLRHFPHPMKANDLLTGAQFEISAVWLATSITLILLGTKSVQQHRRLAKGGVEK